MPDSSASTPIQTVRAPDFQAIDRVETWSGFAWVLRADGDRLPLSQGNPLQAAAQALNAALDAVHDTARAQGHTLAEADTIVDGLRDLVADAIAAGMSRDDAIRLLITGDAAPRLRIVALPGNGGWLPEDPGDPTTGETLGKGSFGPPFRPLFPIRVSLLGEDLDGAVKTGVAAGAPGGRSRASEFGGDAGEPNRPDTSTDADATATTPCLSTTPCSRSRKPPFRPDIPGMEDGKDSPVSRTDGVRCAR
jgi:hypothetical protein